MIEGTDAISQALAWLAVPRCSTPALSSPRQTPPLAHRWCFYPGSDKNVQLFQKTFPDCQSFHASDAAQGTSPLLFAEGLTEDECRGATESWCTALQEVRGLVWGAETVVVCGAAGGEGRLG